MANTTRKSSAKKWTLIVLIIFVLVAVIGGTYSRYSSEGSGTGTATVAKWAIKINTVDITPAAATTFDITFNEVPNDDVVDGKIAPASRLYADFVVDPTGSEVAIDYSFALGTITASAGDVPTGIAVEKVCLVNVGTDTNSDGIDDDGDTITVADEKYSGTIELSSQSAAMTANDAVTVRVYLKWTNDDANNVNHTAAGVATPNLSMTVTGTAQQHISE